MADDPTPDPTPDPAPDPTPDPEPTPDPKPETDWKREARKHEDRAKKNQKELDTLREAQKQHDDASKTEHERAIEKAREEARTEALTEADKDRRKDRLAVAATRLAAKGVTVGDKTVRFDDPEDALVFLEREGTDDLFDDEGQVQTDTLETALADLLTRKPRLRADGETPPADPDSRKGDPADNDIESMTPEDHERRKYPANFK